jgi:hypothetical protein
MAMVCKGCEMWLSDDGRRCRRWSVEGEERETPPAAANVPPRSHDRRRLSSDYNDAANFSRNLGSW